MRTWTGLSQVKLSIYLNPDDVLCVEGGVGGYSDDSGALGQDKSHPKHSQVS